MPEKEEEDTPRISIGWKIFEHPIAPILNPLFYGNKKMGRKIVAEMKAPEV